MRVSDNALGLGPTMGFFTYEAMTTAIEDRALAHLQIVMFAKLRRGESFAFSWRNDDDTPVERTSVWVHPGCKIAFEYLDPGRHSIDRGWVDRLNDSGYSAAGLYLVPEMDETHGPVVRSA